MKTLALSLVFAASTAANCAASESRVSPPEIVSLPVQRIAATTKEKSSKSSAPAPSAPVPEKTKAPTTPPREQKPAPPAVLFM